MDGKPRHVLLLTLGFVLSERHPSLRAAFNESDPEEILSKERNKLEARKTGSKENSKN